MIPSKIYFPPKPTTVAVMATKPYLCALLRLCACASSHQHLQCFSFVYCTTIFHCPTFFLLFFSFCDSMLSTGNSVTTQPLALQTPVQMRVNSKGIASYLSSGQVNEKDILVVLEVIVEAMCCVCVHVQVQVL